MTNDLTPYTDRSGWQQPEEPLDAILIVAPHEAPAAEQHSPRPSSLRWVMPLLLFVATCLSTFWVGLEDSRSLTGGLIYSASLMMILGCHEMGHFLQARRYGVPTTLPIFIPLPFSMIGTLGAVIAMSPHIKSRRALFDIGITGPLAGLLPTLIFSGVGLYLSTPVPMHPSHGPGLGAPPLFWMIAGQFFGAIPNGYAIDLHPMALAGWVGLLITALNLIPIGQLDGGHVLYALLRRGAHIVAMLLLAGAAAAVVFGYYWWTLMVVLLVLMGPKHPPTADDHAPLGFWRVALGWLTLAFIPIGFTPAPFGM